MAITYGAPGAVASGSTSIDITLPATIAAGDLIVVAICSKYQPNVPADVDGWTKIYAAGGPASAGTDTGPTYATIFYKTAVGNEDGTTFSTTISSGNVCVGRAFVFTKTETEWDIAYSTGSQATDTQSWSVTAAGILVLWLGMF